MNCISSEKNKARTHNTGLSAMLENPMQPTAELVIGCTQRVVQQILLLCKKMQLEQENQKEFFDKKVVLLCAANTIQL